MDENGYGKYVALAFALILAGFGITRLLQRQRKPRSFRDDPIGALKDRSEIVANKAQIASEEALTRIQATLEEIRDRLPEVSNKQIQRGRKDLTKRINDLTGQAQDLVKELRGNSVFSR
ncbi:MAG TPA: hypothetical protein PLO33_10185 [Kouleothrix sp.]|uniref:hypothetical protein n=1 Tax=Kouleothrix sp. TaxID=2779161 RepID=UPI002CE907FD|nr:hypothetical protein [Kouleothrix sp.]HRC76037.1 hypothetical protein [Kouleothrix sp.]